MSKEKTESVLKFVEWLLDEFNESLKTCSYAKKTIEDMPSRALLELALMAVREVE